MERIVPYSIFNLWDRRIGEIFELEREYVGWWYKFCVCLWFKKGAQISLLTTNYR